MRRPPGHRHRDACLQSAGKLLLRGATSSSSTTLKEEAAKRNSLGAAGSIRYEAEASSGSNSTGEVSGSSARLLCTSSCVSATTSAAGAATSGVNTLPVLLLRGAQQPRLLPPQWHAAPDSRLRRQFPRRRPSLPPPRKGQMTRGEPVLALHQKPPGNGKWIRPEAGPAPSHSSGASISVEGLATMTPARGCGAGVSTGFAGAAL